MLHNESKKEKYEVDEQWTRFGPQDSPIWKTVLKGTCLYLNISSVAYSIRSYSSRQNLTG